MPQTKEYIDRVDKAIKATQAKNGMTSKNVRSLQKLLKYYPENKGMKVDGLYGSNTIKAVNSFYKQYYWTPERKVERLSEMHGEKYIMQSEMEGMKASKSKKKQVSGY
jgi:murein L,D-transpeptidase YcbB/YkuD